MNIAGKSSIAKEIAKDLNLKLIDVRLSQCDPVDLAGMISHDGKRGKYLPMETFPLEGDAVPVDFNGWFLLLDEFNSAPLSVQAAAYQLVLDRQVGQVNLHKNVAIMCAGNLSTDNAIVNRMSTAMQSRMIHLELTVNSKDWLEWAADNEIDYRILAYINFRPEHLHNFNPKHSDKTFPCPRTWEFLSKLIKPYETITYKKLPLVIGSIGEGTGREFSQFCEIFESLPTFDEILNTPDKVVISSEPSIKYAITGLIAKNAEESNIGKLKEFVVRLPVEFQIIFLKQAARNCPKIIMSPTYTSLTMSIGSKYL